MPTTMIVLSEVAGTGLFVGSREHRLTCGLSVIYEPFYDTGPEPQAFRWDAEILRSGHSLAVIGSAYAATAREPADDQLHETFDDPPRRREEGLQRPARKHRPPQGTDCRDEQHEHPNVEEGLWYCLAPQQLWIGVEQQQVAHVDGERQLAGGSQRPHHPRQLVGQQQHPTEHSAGRADRPQHPQRHLTLWFVCKEGR